MFSFTIIWAGKSIIYVCKYDQIELRRGLNFFKFKLENDVRVLFVEEKLKIDFHSCFPGEKIVLKILK